MITEESIDLEVKLEETSVEMNRKKTKCKSGLKRQLNRKICPKSHYSQIGISSKKRGKYYPRNNQRKNIENSKTSFQMEMSLTVQYNG
jgi:hypothetical protein